MQQQPARQRIAIVGAGIAGLTTAWLLSRRHEVTVFCADDWVGGHTHTIDVPVGARSVAVDTGFIVFNDRTYPNFNRLLAQLGVPFQDTSMGFSVHCERSGLEYAGGSLDQLFAQRRNLASPRFLRMVRDILRFNREAPALLESAEGELTLGEYLARHGYSEGFRDDYIVPMGAAIWSANVDTMLAFPAKFFVRFFRNHGLLEVRNRPQWHVIRGGSRAYVEPLVRPFADRIRVRTPVRRARRLADGVELVVGSGDTLRYDQVVFACHSDQALAILGADATPAERAILGALPYQENEVVLHTDVRLLPRLRKVWSSWNHWIPRQPGGRVQLTYNMNILQGLATPETFCVTLNQGEDIDRARILGRYTYHHPVFTLEGVQAQQRVEEIDGANRSYFCGAYWHNGFHEDGVASALRVARKFGEAL